MRTRKRPKAHRLWRSGLPGLKRIQELIERLEKACDDDREVLMLGIPDLKLRLNKELRDNASFELRYRRETWELEDIELARETNVPLLLKIKGEIEAQASRLISLHDLGRAVDSLAPVPRRATVTEGVQAVFDPVQEATDNRGPVGEQHVGTSGPSVLEPLQSEQDDVDNGPVEGPVADGQVQEDQGEAAGSPLESQGSSEGHPEVSAKETTTEQMGHSTDEDVSTEEKSDAA